MNFYEILELNDDDKKLSPIEFEKKIKSNYRNLCKKHHPDAGGSEEEFKKVATAFEILSDPEKRRQYDQKGSNFGNLNMDDIINQFFGGFAKTNGFGSEMFTNGVYTNQRGSDLKVTISLSLEDMMFGVQKNIRYKRYDRCQPCNGVGAKEVKSCNICGGSGLRIQRQNTPFGHIQNTTICNVCGGQGKIPLDTCGNCQGKGIHLKDEIIDVYFPPGSNKELIFTKAGSGNSVKNGTNGNLIITVNEIPDAQFTRSDDNLLIEKKISISDAILGTKFTIKCIHEEIEIIIPKGIQSGEKITTIGKGIPNIDSKIKGNIITTVSIKIPKTITPSELELIEKISECSSFKV